MRKLLAILAILAAPAQAQQPNGTINTPIYATGYISQVGGTNVTTTIKSQPNHPTNLNIYTTDAISSTWTIKLPNPAFEGQILSFNCGAAVNAISVISSDGSFIDSTLPITCSLNTGFTIQFDQRSNIWRNIGSNNTSTFKPFTGVASQWPWQLNADGTFTLKQPDVVDVTNAAAKVNSNTALAALSSTASPVLRLGYASAGDAPPVVYTYSGSSCSLNAGAGDGGSQVPRTAGGCWEANFGPTIDLRNFGVVCDNSANIAPDWQKAINYAQTSGGKVLTLPAGLSCALTSSVQITGNYITHDFNHSAIYVKGNAFTGSAILVGTSGSSATNPTRDYFRNIEIIMPSGSSNAIPQGYGIVEVNNGNEIHFDHVNMYVDTGALCSYGTWLRGGSGQYAYFVQNFRHGGQGCTRTDGSGLGAWIEVGDSSATVVTDVNVGPGNSGGGQSCIDLRYVDGFYSTGPYDCIQTVSSGVTVYPADGQRVSSVFLDHAVMDTTGNHGFNISGTGTGSVTGFHITNSWCSSNAVAGIYAAFSGINGLYIQGTECSNNQQTGMLFGANAKNIVLTNNNICNNSQAANATYHGIYMTSVSYVTMANNLSGNCRSNIASNKQAYGILIDTGTDYVNLCGNITQGNQTGGLSNGSPGAHSGSCQGSIGN